VGRFAHGFAQPLDELSCKISSIQCYAAERFTTKKFTNPRQAGLAGRRPNAQWAPCPAEFPDHADAIAKKSELELEALNQPATLGLKRTRLTDEQLTEAEAAFLKLNGKGSLLEAVHRYLITGKQPIARITVQEAYELYLADAVQRGLRPRTIQELRSRVGFLVTYCGNRWLEEVGNPDFRQVVYRHPDQAASPRMEIFGC